MPVRKMRDITEAAPPAAEPLRPENLRAAFELSDAARRLRPVASAPGVRRYRSIEEASETDR